MGRIRDGVEDGFEGEGGLEMAASLKNYVIITSGRFRGRKILTPGSATHPMGARERLALFNSLVALWRQSSRGVDSANGSASSAVVVRSAGSMDSVVSAGCDSGAFPDALLSGAKVLDAYAGSGALGFEALSRGAASVVFIEKSTKAAAVIRRNAGELGATEQCEIVAGDVARVLDNFSKIWRHGSHRRLLPQKLLKTTFGGPPPAAPPVPPSFTIILIDPPYGNYNPAEFTPLASLLAPDGLLALSSPITPPSDLFASYGLQMASTHKYAAAHLTIFTKI